MTIWSWRKIFLSIHYLLFLTIDNVYICFMFFKVKFWSLKYPLIIMVIKWSKEWFILCLFYFFNLLAIFALFLIFWIILEYRLNALALRRCHIIHWSILEFLLISLKLLNWTESWIYIFSKVINKKPMNSHIFNIFFSS